MKQTRRLAAVIVLVVSMIATHVLPVSNEPIKINPPKSITTIITSTTNSQLTKTDNETSKPNKSIKTFRVTAYTGIDKGQSGKDITASGTKAVAYRTVAASPEIPFGTVLIDVNTGERYIVEDRGGAIKGASLDLFVGHKNVKDALNYGVQYKTFEVVLPE